jgi:DNA-directed RNA polymerase I, II, and III subunit RPABC2
MFEENEDADFTNENDFLDEEEDITDFNIEDNDISVDNSIKIMNHNDVLEHIKNTVKKTYPILTKFERARIIGVRLQQLAYGAKPRVDTTNLRSLNEIVQKELILRKIPFIIKRPLPNNTFEYWKLEEFKEV